MSNPLRHAFRGSKVNRKPRQPRWLTWSAAYNYYRFVRCYDLDRAAKLTAAWWKRMTKIHKVSERGELQ